MKIGELMTKRVISVRPGDSLEKARQLFRTNNIHHLIVIDGDAVVGVVTHRDAISKTTGTVSEVMCCVATVDATSTVKNAASLMIGGATGCVAVVDDGRLAGIVTTTDLMRVLNNTATLPLR